ncbi:hypothetical protein ACHAXS_014202, partial [Conticribra weissflogii]
TASNSQFSHKPSTHESCVAEEGANKKTKSRRREISSNEENTGSLESDYFINKFTIGEVGNSCDMIWFDDFEDEYLQLEQLREGDGVFVLRSNNTRTFALVEAKSQGPDAILTILVDEEGNTKKIPMQKWSKYIRLPNFQPRCSKSSFNMSGYVTTSSRAVNGAGCVETIMKLSNKSPPIAEVEFYKCDSIHTTSAKESHNSFSKCERGLKKFISVPEQKEESFAKQTHRRSFLRYSESDATSQKTNSKHCRHSFHTSNPTSIHRYHSVGDATRHDDLKSSQKSFLFALGYINNDFRRKSSVPVRPRAA